MTVVLRAVEEAKPGERWGRTFRAMWPAYRRWFLREGDAARPSYGASKKMLARYMPELVPIYDELVELAGGGDAVARCLSLYRPTPYVHGCSQAVWLKGGPRLLRNYDYAPGLWEALLLRTEWIQPVVAMSDCGWGALDGVNAAGVSVSLAFGGQRVTGDGFGIPLVLRYLLETCSTTEEAAAVLTRVPSHMAYNITVLDAKGAFVTAYVGPDRNTTLSRRRVATNHQPRAVWSQYLHAVASIDRFNILDTHVDAPAETAERFRRRFLEPPTYQVFRPGGWGTLYTAVYDPVARSAEYCWPGGMWTQSLADFRESTVAIDYTAHPT